MFSKINNKDMKKGKSQQSSYSKESESKETANMNLYSGNASTTKKSSGVGTDVKSDHGDKKFGFFENFRRQIASLGRKETTRSQGANDHINHADLMDLAADLGCISADEQSFTFKPDESSNNSYNK